MPAPAGLPCKQPEILADPVTLCFPVAGGGAFGRQLAGCLGPAASIIRSVWMCATGTAPRSVGSSELPPPHAQRLRSAAGPAIEQVCTGENHNRALCCSTCWRAQDDHAVAAGRLCLSRGIHVFE